MKTFIILTIISLTFYWQHVNTQNININYALENFSHDVLGEQFTNTNFTLDDAKNLLRKKCKKAARALETPQTYENIELAANKLLECANDIANITTLLGEIEAARPVGDLDVVFQKYCNKLPQAESCLWEFNEQLLPCLTPAERAQNAILMHIITSLLSFACYKNGDQLALFISEEGPECLEAHKDNITNCMNATFAAYTPINGQLLPNELPELVMGPKHCIDLHDFEECVLSYLEKCKELTPANVIESLFRYVRNETKCQEEIDKVISFKVQQRNVGVSTTLCMAIYLTTFLFVLSVFLNYYF